MEEAPKLRPEVQDIFERLDRANLKQRDLAAAIGIEENKISKARKGGRLLKASEVIKAKDWLSIVETEGDYQPDAEQPMADPQISYVEVPVLPTFAGMGGGGTGDADRETALVPRALVEDILQGKPADFLLINVRGDSMEGDFRHGDQLLVDMRDRSPTQPGPFALWFDDEYVVKNVERVPGGQVRIFSSNPKYSTVSIATEETRIIGRPVWFGRRL